MGSTEKDAAKAAKRRKIAHGEGEAKKSSTSTTKNESKPQPKPEEKKTESNPPSSNDESATLDNSSGQGNKGSSQKTFRDLV